MTIEVPEELETLPTATWHASLHASGRRHVNANGSGALRIADAHIGDIRTLNLPFLLAALLIKPPAEWKEHAGRLDKGSGKFLKIDVASENWTSRVYLEFYISPNVAVDPSEPILRGLSREGLWVSAPLDDSGKTILSCRVSPVEGAIGNWRPDATIIVLLDRNGEAATGSADPR